MKVGHSIVAREEINLNIPAETVRKFIKTPERILDYYPGGKSCGELAQDGYFYCRAASVISLLQVIEDSPQYVRLRVWTATSCPEPYTVDELKARAFFVMDEGWELEEKDGRTRLLRTWFDVNKIRLRFLPMASMIKWTVKKESRLISQRWEARFQEEAK